MDIGEFTISLTWRDLLRGNLVLLYTRPAIWSFRVVIFGLAIYEALLAGLPVTVVSALACGGLELLVVTLVVAGVLIQAKGGPRIGGGLSLQHIRLTSDALVIASDAGSVSHPWRLVGRPSVRFGLVFVSIKAHGFYFFPVRQLGPDQTRVLKETQDSLGELKDAPPGNAAGRLAAPALAVGVFLFGAGAVFGYRNFAAGPWWLLLVVVAVAAALRHLRRSGPRDS